MTNEFEITWADILPLDLDKIPPKAKYLWKDAVDDPIYEGTATKCEPIIYVGNQGDIHFFIARTETNSKTHLLKMMLWRNDDGIIQKKSVKIL